MIVNKLEPVTLVGGGQLGNQDLTRALTIGKSLVAADGGADAAMRFGVEPDAVIGDMDSLSEHSKLAIPKAHQHHIAEQNSTDFDKCLRSIHAPLVLGVGFMGARIDHQLGNFNTLVRFPKIKCILLGAHEIAFLAPPSLTLDLKPESIVSLFPFGAVEGHSEGLEWPIQGLNFAPDGQIGTLNKALGAVSLTFTAPKMLLVLPQKYLETVSAALLSNPSHWS